MIRRKAWLRSSKRDQPIGLINKLMFLSYILYMKRSAEIKCMESEVEGIRRGVELCMISILFE